MAIFSVRSIKAKMVLWVGMSMLLTFGLIVAYAAVNQRKIAIETAEKAILADGQNMANAIKAKLEVPLDAVRTLAQVLSTAPGTGLTREQVNRMLKAVTEKNPDFIGTYTLWEPDAFDGKDNLFKGRPPYDQTGRFIAYWNRGASGVVKVETPEGYETEGAGDYYQLPKRRQQECIIEPYLYPVQGKDVLMVSLVAPILKKGVFKGIAGVDVGVKELQSYLKTHNPYPGEATVTLISYGGLIAASDGHDEMAGGHMRKIHQDCSLEKPSLNWMKDVWPPLFRFI